MTTEREVSQIVVVTGAASGIGAAIAERLFRDGHHVCATDVREDALRARFEAWRDGGGETRGIVCGMDVRSASDIEEVETRVLSRWGRVDALINNAGIFDTAPLLLLEEEAFQRMLDVNLIGAYRATRVFTREMIERGSGTVINISSIAALMGAPRAAHYAASKGGLLALSRSLAVELAPHKIRVHAVLPGYIDSPMLGDHRESISRLGSWLIPVKRLGRAEEVAELVAFLVSADSEYLTGTEITVDGGLHLA